MLSRTFPSNKQESLIILLYPDRYACRIEIVSD